MEIPAQSWVTIGIAILSALIASGLAMFKWAMNVKEKELKSTLESKEREFDQRLSAAKEASTQSKESSGFAFNRLHEIDIIVTEIRASIMTIQEVQRALKSELSQLESKTVTTQLYEQRMSSMEKSLNRLVDDISALLRQRTYSNSALKAQNPKE